MKLHNLGWGGLLLVLACVPLLWLVGGWIWLHIVDWAFSTSFYTGFWTLKTFGVGLLASAISITFSRGSK